MNEVMPYPIMYPPQETPGLSMKQAVGYTLLAGAAIGVVVYVAKKSIKERKADKADQKSFKEGTAESTAKDIHMALHNGGMPGGDMPKLRLLISGIKSQEEMTEIATAFTAQYDKELFRSMEDILQASEYMELRAIKDSKPEKKGQKVTGEVLYKQWAKRFKSAFEYKYLMFDAVNVEGLKTTMKDIPTQRAFVNVGVEFFKAYKIHLLDLLRDKLHDWDYYPVLKLLTDKPKA